MYTNGININASSYQSVYASTDTSLAVPVKPSALIYSHFDNVHGVAAKGDQQAVSLNKLRILNTLIDQLKTLKQHSFPQDYTDTLSSSDQDKLLHKYQQQLKTTVQNPPYGVAGLMPEAGSLVSISL